MNYKTIIQSVSPSFLRDYINRIESSPLGYRLAKGAFWSLAGAIISRSLALLSSIIVARILGKEGFGELGIIQSTIGMFGVFAGFGLGLTATKHVAEFKNKDPERTGRIIGLSNVSAIISGGVMALILIIIAPWLASKTLAAPHLAEYLQIGAGLLFLSAVTGAQTGALSGFEAFKTIAKVNFWSGITNFPLIVFGVYMGGLKGAVWGLVAGMAVNWLLNKIALKDETERANIKINFKEFRQELKVLWNFSLPAFLSGIMVSPVNWICNAMLVNQPNGYVEMGIFNAANQWFTALLFIPGILGSALLPILSEQMGLNNRPLSKKALTLSIKLNGASVLPLVMVGCLISPFIMQLYGETFSEAWPTLVIVLLTAGLLSIQTPVGNIIAASGRMWLGFIMNAGWGLLFISITWTLLNWGAIGLAIARGGAYVIHAIWTFWFAYSVIQKFSKNYN